MKILIIDDDLRLGRCIGRMLRTHDVTLETEPACAIERLHLGEWYDLILCDLNMPGARGNEVFAQVRSQLGADAPMLVLMSGADPMLVSGADGELSKPFRAEELQAIVAQVVALRAKRELARTISMKTDPHTAA